MTDAGMSPIGPKRAVGASYRRAECKISKWRARPARCPIGSNQVPGFSPLFALPHDVIELAHSRIDLGSHAAPSR